MRLIVTRPAEDAERQARALAALGHEPLIHSLLTIDYPPLAPISLTGVQALIATSRNALRGLERNEAFATARRLMLFCVADKTADYAREAGFTRVMHGAGTAKDLVPLITTTMHPEDGALLYLSGEHLAFDLETPLRKAGFAIPRIIAYQAREADQEAAFELAGAIRQGVDGVVLMSARTGAVFVRLIKRLKLEGEVRAITCYCYSDAIAEALSEIEGLTIAVSSLPTEEDMIALIGPAPFRGAALADLQDALGKR